MPLDRKLRYGMVGGGPGAFIGEVHRKAAALDGRLELVAGAFSSSPEKSRRQGRALHLDPARVYDSYEAMAEAEAALSEEERIDLVSIVTPNHLHFEVARAFIERGFHVVCDKPLTTTLDEAETLCRLVEEAGIVFALTHNYSGYPMVKQARALVRQGTLGEVRKVVVEYPQGWLYQEADEDNKQAEWRTDPKRAGAGALGDIGTHAEHLARYVTDLDIESLCADVTSIVSGRRVDDDANLLVRYENGARGVLYCSQVATGEENNLRLRVYGTEASLDWSQEHPNELVVRYPDAPVQVYKPGNEYLSDAALDAGRLPAGHPEGFIEAFANLYVEIADAVSARMAGESLDASPDVPTVQDGAIGVHFIQKALESGEAQRWIDAQYVPPGA